MRSIVITGPESSGKTTLARDLALHFGVPWVPEYARTYLSGLGRPYQEKDLEVMGRRQLALQKNAYASQIPFVVCDTGLMVLYVWSMVRFGRASSWLRQALAQDTTNLYLLSKPDIPWEPDPLRENPGDRDKLLTRYQRELDNHHRPFAIVEGPCQDRRLAMAIELVHFFLF